MPISTGNIPKGLAGGKRPAVRKPPQTPAAGLAQMSSFAPPMAKEAARDKLVGAFPTPSVAQPASAPGTSVAFPPQG